MEKKDKITNKDTHLYEETNSDNNVVKKDSEMSRELDYIYGKK